MYFEKATQIDGIGLIFPGTINPTSDVSQRPMFFGHVLMVE